MTAPMTSREDLLPCPFCGSEAVDRRKIDGFPMIYCGGEECFGPQTTAKTFQDALVQWNTRAGLAQTAGPDGAECYYALMGLTSYVLANFPRSDQWIQGGRPVVTDARGVLARYDDPSDVSPVTSTLHSPPEFLAPHNSGEMLPKREPAGSGGETSSVTSNHQRSGK